MKRTVAVQLSNFQRSAPMLSASCIQAQGLTLDVRGVLVAVRLNLCEGIGFRHFDLTAEIEMPHPQGFRATCAA